MVKIGRKMANGRLLFQALDTVVMYRLLADSHITIIIYQVARYNMIPLVILVFNTNEAS